MATFKLGKVLLGFGRCFFPHFQNIHLMSRWQIGRGEIRFWSSNWSGEIIDPISTSTLTVREAKNNMGLERTGLSETQIQALENIVCIGCIRRGLSYIHTNIYCLVSKCCCCTIPKRETLHRLFIQSDLAKEIWGLFME